jgi:hypothetical protein
MLSPEGHLLWLATISYEEGPFKSIAKSVEMSKDENGEFTSMANWQWCENVAFCAYGSRASQIFSRDRSTQVSGRLGDKYLRHRQEIVGLYNVLSRTILFLTLERAWKASMKLDLNVESQSQTLELFL